MTKDDVKLVEDLLTRIQEGLTVDVGFTINVPTEEGLDVVGVIQGRKFTTALKPGLLITNENIATLPKYEGMKIAWREARPAQYSMEENAVNGEPISGAFIPYFDDNGNKLKSYEERCVEYMQDYFEKDRYNFSQLIDEIRIMKVVDDVIIDKETGIEIYEGNKVPKDILIGILQEFSAMDNLVQDECKNEYEEKDFSIDNYLFAPAWIRVSDNEVVVGYWGIKVNSSFDKVFVKKDGKWKMKL